MRVSYLNAFGLIPEPDHDEQIVQGDIVRTGANPTPSFHVVAVSGDRAWLRDLQNGAEAVVDVRRCRRLNGAPALDRED
jgi:hypothetical protein